MGIKTLLIGYGIIGIFELFGAYFAYMWVFVTYGESPSSIVGSGL